MGIDKGNTNYDVMLFDSIYGIKYPGVSGDEGGGNAVHLLYDIQATPSIVVITPDKLIASHWVWPPNMQNIVDSVMLAGGVQQDCITGTVSGAAPGILLTIGENPVSERLSFTLDPGRDRELEITVRNLGGRKVAGLGPKSYTAGKQSHSISMKGLPGGLYFVQVIENGVPLDVRKIILRR